MVTKRKTVRNVHANAGVRVKYRKQLDALIDEMAASIEYWVKAQYRKDGPRLAEDATPSQAMIAALNTLAKKWQKRFTINAPKIAETYVKNCFKSTDSAFHQALKESGFAVKFKMTPAMNDAFHATLAENVSLIKSIPDQYLKQIEGAVMRSFTVGGDLQALVKDIQKYKPMTNRRAAFIARDQSNKANAVVTRARQMELGITEAIWMHSSAGKKPRPSHVAFNQKRYNVNKGALIDGEYIYPGQLPNCRCTSRSVLPF